MWVHRIVGVLLALMALAVLVGLFSLIYAPIPNAESILLALGIPLALLAGGFGIVGFMIGCWLAFTPGHAVRNTGGLLGRPTPPRQETMPESRRTGA